jgi:MerR family transcriptional regulator, light-induced transcriptional regulator
MSGEQDIKHTLRTPGPAEVSRLGPAYPNRFDANQMRDTLSDAIRTIVLPRLIEKRQTETLRRAATTTIRVSDTTDLLALATTPDPAPAEALISRLKLQGASREAILLDLIAPVARRLGELWREDRLTFADVTLGIGRLRALIRSNSMPDSGSPRPAIQGRILVASAPGEHHTLAAAIVTDLFRTAGWDAESWSGMDPEQLVRVARQAPAEVIGISIAHAAALPGLRALSAKLRLATGRRLVGIIAGGGALADTSLSAENLGVDIIVRDAREAVTAAGSLLHR